MKIAFFNVSGKGGIAHYNFFLCNALEKKGVPILMITTKKNELDLKNALFDYRNVLSIHHQYRSFLIKGLFYSLSLFKLLSYAIRKKPDIIHWHELKIYPMEYALIKYLKSINIKFILSSHDILNQEKRAVTPFLTKLYNQFDLIIAHTQDSRNTLLELFHLDPEKVHIIPIGEYTDIAKTGIMNKSEARKKLGILSDRKTLLFFGYIRKYKGLGVLLKSMPAVLNVIPETVLIIAGEPKEDFKSYKMAMHKLHITDSIHSFLQYIPLDEIGLYFSASDIVVLPYLHIYQSAVLHLAFAFQKPVIVTNVGGLPEVVADKKSGFVVPVNDSHALANTIIEALSDTNRLEKMGHYAFAHSRNELSWDVIAEKTAGLYRLLTDTRKSNA